MANVAYKEGKFFLRNGLYFKTNFEVGDTVVRTTRASSSYSTIQRGDQTSIIGVDNVGYVSSDYFYHPDGKRFFLHEQKLRINTSTQAYNGSNFTLLKKGNNMLQLEPNRPTFVREFVETTVDGKVTRDYQGEWIPFDNVSAAQVYCSNEISNSIRTTNTYRKFAILIEKAIAQAKKPEIEFA